jgi:hypothetical protein
MTDFLGYVTSEYITERRRPRNGPFLDIDALKSEIEKAFYFWGDVQVHFGDLDSGGEAFSFDGYDHPDVRHFPHGKPFDYDPLEDPNGYGNSGFYEFLECLSRHLIPDAHIIIYYIGNEGLRPPLCGMSWWIYRDHIDEIDISSRAGVQRIWEKQKT